MCYNFVMKKNKRLNNVFIFECCFLFISVILTLINVNDWLTVYFDSDMGSMLVQDKLLSDEGSIVSPNWYYSTEISIIGHNLIYPFIFKFFDNWHLVRMTGVVIMYVLLAASFMYLLKSLKVKHIPLFTVLLFVPLNDSYFVFVLAGCEYINLISLTFLSIALVISWVNSKNHRAFTIKLILLLVISFLMGLQGMRQVAILYLPLFISSIFFYLIVNWKDIKKNLSLVSFVKDKLCLITFFNLFASLLGLLLNIFVLHKYYSFPITSYSSTINVTSFSFDKLSDLLNMIFIQFGFSPNLPATSLRCIVSNIWCFVLILLTVFAIVKIILKWKNTNPQHLFLVLFYITGFIVFLFIMCFTDFPITSRNMMSHVILYICILSILLSYTELKSLKDARFISIFLVLILIFVSYFGMYRNATNKANCLDFRSESEVYELPTIANTILKNDLRWGYTTTLYGSVLSELSNGNVEVWNYGLTDGGLRTDELSKWLQEKSHFFYRPSSKLFVLLTNVQDNNTHFVDRNKLNIIYKSENFVLYSFTNVNELEENLIQSTDTKDLNNYIKE